MVFKKFWIRQRTRVGGCHYVDGLRSRAHLVHGLFLLNHRAGHTAGLSVHQRMVQIFPGTAQRLALHPLLFLFDGRRRDRHRLGYLPRSRRPGYGAGGVDVVDAVQVVLGASPHLVVLVPVVDADVVLSVRYRVQRHRRARVRSAHLPFFDLAKETYFRRILRLKC